jgi:vacuolar-type H+-ATPase subunit E/Vma4
VTADEHSPDERLLAEVLAAARQEERKILDEARREADAILAAGAKEAADARRKRLDRATAEAARRAELVMATVPVEERRLRADRIEAQLDAVRAEARRLLLEREGFDCRETIVRLAADAVSRMAGAGFTLKVSPADLRALGAGFGDQVARRAGRGDVPVLVEADPAIEDGGVVVQDASGRQMWDNRLGARLDRMWPELRRRLAVEAGFAGPAKVGGGA